MAPRRHPDSPRRGIFLYILNYTAARPFSRAFRRYKGGPLKVKDRRAAQFQGAQRRVRFIEATRWLSYLVGLINAELGADLEQ